MLALILPKSLAHLLAVAEPLITNPANSFELRAGLQKLSSNVIRSGSATRIVFLPGFLPAHAIVQDLHEAPGSWNPHSCCESLIQRDL